MINLIDEIKKLGLGILFIIVTIFIFTYFKFDLYDRIGYLIIFNGLFFLILAIRSKSIFNIYKFFINCGQIIIFIHLLALVNSIGVFGYVGSIFLICFLILYKRWSKYIEVKQHIETMIWGKPLNEFVKEGKRPPKIELK